jgi:putative OPT family oligopeptide transporter
MSSSEIWNRYVRYIGAGAVATGGFITLIKSIPTMLESFNLGQAQVGKAHGPRTDRTHRDLSLVTCGLLVVAIHATLAFVPGILGSIASLAVRSLASVAIAVFAFFFVTVSSRIVGLVGVTSNPTSGMAIATLLGTSLVFLAAGWTDTHGKTTALMVGTAVCIAASIAGDTSQDLKTGFLLGATPRYQQIAELVGVVTSAGFVCAVVLLLHQTTAGGLGGADLPAPQATLMKLVIDGVIDRNLPWTLIGIGAAIALVAWALRLPVLAFAVGVYLPVYTMAAVFCGGMLRHFLTRGRGEDEAGRRREQGILFGSGLVGGAGLTGVLLALWVGFTGEKQIGDFGPDYGSTPVVAGVVATLAIATILWLMRRSAVADTSSSTSG